MNRLHQALIGILTGCLAAALIVLPAQAQDTITREISDTKAALATDPGSAPLRERLVSLYYLRGVDHLLNYEYDPAIAAFQDAVNASTQGAGLPAGNKAVLEARYGLAYSLYQAGATGDAAVVADDLVQSAGASPRANYLLGVSLGASVRESDFSRGMDVLKSVAGGSGQEAAAAPRSAARLSYAAAMIDYLVDKSGQGASRLNAVVASYGEEPAASSSENLNLHFLHGLLLLDSGDAVGAVTALERVRAADSGYATAAGTTIYKVLGNAYYAAALARLAAGGDSAGQEALALLEKLEAIEGANVVEIHHGKALAYRLMGDQAGEQREMQTIQSLDAAYYTRIKAG